MSRRHNCCARWPSPTRRSSARRSTAAPCGSECIHCNAKLVLADDGRPLGEATLEHIFPQTQGRTDDVDNLAIACARCNRKKGARHDAKKKGERLDQRWRDPPEPILVDHDE